MFRHVLVLLMTVCLHPALTHCVYPDEAAKAPAGTAVKVVEIKDKGANRVIAGMGSISCPVELELGFDETGVVEEMFVEQGDLVEQGQVLARLESSVVRAEKAAQEARLSSVEAEVRFYENEVKRKESLHTKEAISSTEMEKTLLELEKARATVEYVKAEIHTLETRLSKRVLTAPVSGLVTERHASVGSVVMPNSNRIATLVQCSLAHADIELGEKLFGSVRAGMPVKISVDALDGRSFHGRTLRVAPHIDKKNRTFILKLAIDNPELLLRPGMFVRAEIAVHTAVKPVWIPKKALVHSSSPEAAVFVVKDGLALLRRVLVGEAKHNNVRVDSGLEPGDLVVVEGQDKLRDLDEVSVQILTDTAT